MTFYKALNFSTWLTPIVLCYGIMVGVRFYKYLDKVHFFLVIYLVACFTVDIISRILAAIYNNNLISILIFSLLEVVIASVFYQVTFYKKRQPVFIMVTVGIILYMLWEIYTLSYKRPEEFQSYSKSLSSFFIVTMALHLLFDRLKKDRIDKTILNYNVVIISYFTLNMVFYIPINFLINVPSLVKFYFWLINYLLTTTFYILIISAVWKNGKIRKQLNYGSSS